MNLKFSFLFLLAISVFYACDGDGSFVSEHISNPVNGLQSMGSQTVLYCNIDKINGQPVQPGENAIKGEFVEVEGWAIDPMSRSLATSIYVSVEGMAFTSQYQFDRADVAGHFNDPGLTRCGFFAKIRRSELSPGSHDITLFIVSEDGKRYYINPPSGNVRIKL